MVKHVRSGARAVGVFLLTILFVAAAEAGVQDNPDGLAAQYQALLKEYQSQSADFRKASADAERKAAVENMDRFAQKFLELAEKSPRDPIVLEISIQVIRMVNAVDSLTQTSWELGSTVFPGKGPDDAGRGVAALLSREYLRSEKLGLICERMSYGIRKDFEKFLREVMKENPHRDVQGLACLALAQFLNSRRLKLELIKDRPELRKRFEDLFGKDYFEEIERQDRAKAAGEIEAIFEKAEVSYNDVKLPYGGTVGETARSELHEIRHLAIGKQAPDIEGVDQDGAKFKLSDSKGKVVLLYFWQEL